MVAGGSRQYAHKRRLRKRRQPPSVRPWSSEGRGFLLPGELRCHVFDELFDMFDRDGRRGREAGERRGIRGFFARLIDGDEGDDDKRSGYRDDDFDRGDEGRAASRRRRRDDDGFDFGD